MFITQHKKTWPIKIMCEVLDVSRNAYYGHRKKQRDRKSDPQLQKILKCVKEIAIKSRFTYGRRRIKAALASLGYAVSIHKARKLMIEAKVSVRQRKRYKVTTDSKHNQPLFENLLEREFRVEKPDQVYVSDITYLWTQEGWLYLAVVIDLYSRKVVGWSMSSRMKAQLVCDALTMAIWRRRPDAGLLHHSDRGSQYASKAFRELLKKHGVKGSMSRKGNCWDNAVAESFFGSLKQERVHWRQYQTRFEAHQDVLNYISMFYNATRLHSYLGYLSPNQFESETTIITKVA